ncbi:unnamed protein product [Oncorhynchus mykiss]|uniref:Uncharacterized protein n=1 Tax=Oncorhynchus mykiss TaxID=8022 RepID=A0A060YEC6_ONCMY|nr:unnamed protein product [Oncorhynchus mykiss]
MEGVSKPSVGREKELSVGVMSDILSLPSYKDYPAGRPFVNTSLPSYTLTTRNTHTPCQTLSSKAFPESSSAGNQSLPALLLEPNCVWVRQFPLWLCGEAGLHGNSR